MSTDDRCRIAQRGQLLDVVSPAQLDDRGGIGPALRLAQQGCQLLEVVLMARGRGLEQDKVEATIIEAYMPAQISDEELRAIVGDAVAESGASSPREMGKVMSAVMPQVKGRADGKRVSAMVQELLTP